MEIVFLHINISVEWSLGMKIFLKGALVAPLQKNKSLRNTDESSE